MFHVDLNINVTSRVKTAPPPGGHLKYYWEKLSDQVSINVLTNLHKGWTINVTSKVLTRKTAPPLAAIIKKNVMTKFHEDWTINVASRVLTSVFFNLTYFELDQDIIDKNVASRVFTKQNVDDGRRTTDKSYPKSLP
ncbi:hypothetical protein DPMN_096460 [Dreissena polymorpha]|uniref:Uncharacterized protein n=1 Tax=Dreissena polymorpha TaxID=45954 RepID=A0A9D4R4R9_DREPO|nr:hypothetical protein DPMN_096460 [Dreissena polymorpha]